MLELTPKYTSVYSNVRRTLKDLKQSAICSTNWFKKAQLEKLKSIGLPNYFSTIYTCEGLTAKPSQRHFEYILSKENYNPEDCVMIGDSASDLAASQVGIDTILVDYYHEKSDLYDMADVVVTDFGDLNKILRRRK